MDAWWTWKIENAKTLKAHKIVLKARRQKISSNQYRTLLRFSSGGLDNLEVSFLPQARGPGIWKHENFISIKIKENLGIASASAGRGYPTLPPSAEALHKHAGPGPSFVLFAERKSLQKAQRNTPLSGTLVNVPTMTPAPLQKLKYEIVVMIESLPYHISTCAFV